MWAVYAHSPSTSLGNFLSGMETHLSLRLLDDGIHLGNFLSGMETGEFRPGAHLCRPLETSLVEWKQNFAIWENKAGQSLGNFLSGMETEVQEKFPIGYGGSLETSLVEWKPFLKPAIHLSSCGLGNFLSGMETVPSAGTGARRLSLETSLVEWKHTSPRKIGRRRPPWKLP